jgi:hypothetical protein
MTMIRKLVFTALALGFLAGCNDADIASKNLSTAADNFEINRRIVVVNGITGKYELEVAGLCSLGNNDTELSASITCKTGPKVYKKHILRRSDNVFIVAEQLEPQPVSTYHYRVTFKPQAIIPDIDFRGDARELIQ